MRQIVDDTIPVTRGVVHRRFGPCGAGDFLAINLGTGVLQHHQRVDTDLHPSCRAQSLIFCIFQAVNPGAELGLVAFKVVGGSIVSEVLAEAFEIPFDVTDGIRIGDASAIAAEFA